jgi:GNAT superfamily N-acetyltransferase
LEAARSATNSDLPAVVDLATAMLDELRPQRGGTLWLARDARPGPIAESLRALLDRADARVIVGTIDDVVVGFATVEIEALRDGTRLGIVRELFVDPEARGVSIGELIATEIVTFCTAAGCIGIDAYALPGARETKNFFERSGFTARALVMHRKL